MMEHLTNYQMAVQLITAFEGGSNYWLHITTLQYPDSGELAKPLGDEYTPDYIALPFTDGGAVIIADFEDKSVTYRVDKESLERGTNTMRDKYPEHYLDILNETADAETADVFLQCCVLGEIVFG